MEEVVIPMGQHNKSLINIKTGHGIVFKSMAVILNQCFTTATMIVYSHGIMVQEATEDKKFIFDCMLSAEAFTGYVIPGSNVPDAEEDEERFYTLGFNCKDFCDATSSINKKGTVELDLHPSDKNRMTILINNNSSSIQKSFSLVKTTIAPTVAPVYKNHKPTVTVVISAFKDAVNGLKKGRQNIDVHIYAQRKGLKMVNETSQTKQDSACLGDYDSNKPDESLIVVPHSRLKAFCEINNIDKDDTVRIYVPQNKPLRLSAMVKSLGTMNMYISGN